jgi:hypothetical protein
MAKTIRTFDFDINFHGATVIVAKEPLIPRCLNAVEVDANIALLKADLDAVAVRMKEAVRKQEAQPVF